MKKSVTALCIASLISVMGAGVASAAPHYGFAPPTLPSPPWGGVAAVFQGPTNLKKGILTLPCTSTFTVQVTETVHSPAQPPAHGDTAKVTAASFSGSNPLCGTVSAAGLPWTVTAGSLTSVTAAGVAVNTPIGNCSPSSLTGAWTNGPPAAMSFTNQPLSPDCFVTGTLTQISGPAASVVFVP